MSWFTSGQHDQNERTWLFDSSDGAYAAKRAVIESISGSFYTIADGFIANTKVVTGYATDAQIASNSLDLDDAAVIDRVHYYVNPYAGTYSKSINSPGVSIRVSPYGDRDPQWGKFKVQPAAIATTGIDRLVQHWKDGGETVLYVGQENGPDGSDGTTYRKRKRIRDVLHVIPASATHNITAYSIVVFCGRLSRARNEGSNPTNSQFLTWRSGTSGDRTQILGHPVDTAQIMGGRRLGGGGGAEPADFTDEGSGVWSINLSSETNFLDNANHFVLSDAGGTLRPLTKVSSLAACQSTSDSFFPEENFSGSDDRIYVHLADGSNPKTTTYFAITSVAGIQPYIERLTFWDLYGIEFYQCNFKHKWSSDWTINAYKFLYHKGVGVRDTSNYIHDTTGQFVDVGAAGNTTLMAPSQPENRYAYGGTMQYLTDGWYDTGVGSAVHAPINTQIHDTYFYGIGYLTANTYNIALGNNDSHSVCQQGGIGITWRNLTMEKCNHHCVNIYAARPQYPDPAVVISDGAVTNGTFTTDLTGWTTTGTVTQSSGVCSFSTGSIEQQITIGAGYTGSPQIFTFTLPASGTIQVSVGTTSGGTDIMALTTHTADEFGNGCAYFTPNATSFYIKFTKSGSGTIDNIALLQDRTGTPMAVSAFPSTTSYVLPGAPDPLQAYKCGGYLKDVLIQHLWIYDIITTNPIGVTSEGITITGDNGTYGRGDTQNNIQILDCIQEGQWGYPPDTDGAALRTKNKQPGPAYDRTQMQIKRNRVRGAYVGFYSVETTLDENGDTVDTSWTFENNDIDAITYLVHALNNQNPTRHNQYSNNNIFRTNSGGIFRNHTTNKADLNAWSTSGVPAGDTYDTNSTHIAIAAYGSDPTLVISGGNNYLGATLTAACSDGTAENLVYQWFRNDLLITGATNLTYDATIANGNAAGDTITCVVKGHKASELAGVPSNQWFIITSNTVTLLAASDVYAYTDTQLGLTEPTTDVVAITQQQREDGYPPAAAGGTTTHRPGRRHQRRPR